MPGRVFVILPPVLILWLLVVRLTLIEICPSVRALLVCCRVFWLSLAQFVI